MVVWGGRWEEMGCGAAVEAFGRDEMDRGEHGLAEDGANECACQSISGLGEAVGYIAGLIYA